MARIQLNFPEHAFTYCTEHLVHPSEINAAHHVSSETMVAIISKVRAAFMNTYDLEDVPVAGLGFIMTDLAVCYRSEAHAGDLLHIEAGMLDLNPYGGDIIFRLSKAHPEKLVALAKYGIVFFDYNTNTVRPIPENFAAHFCSMPALG